MTDGLSLNDVLFSLGGDGSGVVPFDEAHCREPSYADVLVAGDHYTNMSDLDVVDPSLFNGCELDWPEAEVILNDIESQDQADTAMVPPTEVYIPDLDFLDFS